MGNSKKVSNILVALQIVSMTCVSSVIAAPYNGDVPINIDAGDIQTGNMIHLNNGADLIVEEGIDSAEQAAKNGGNSSFFAFKYSNTTTNGNVTKVGVEDINMIFGTANSSKSSKGDLTKAIFLEYGSSNISSEDKYSSNESLANGTGKNIGVGILAKQVWIGNHHLDGYIRYGYMEDKYTSNMAMPQKTSYNTHKPYYGTYLGYGQKHKLSKHADMDVYGKYFYSHIPGRKAYVDALKENICFEGLDSHRIKLGSKIVWDFEKEYKTTYYADLALEHEFANVQKAQIYGMDLDESELKGTSCILTLGIKNKFGYKDCMTFTAALQGAIGTRHGAGGNVAVQWSF